MNILAPRLEGSRWLDLFSGSGVMGCEALERGAQRVVAIENDLRTADICKRNLLTVRESSESHASVQVVRRDCRSWLHQCRQREHFDLIYLDPPYEAGLHTPILDGLAAGGWATSSSLVICEHRSKRDLDAGDAWITVDRRRYGTTGLLFLSLQTHCHHDGIDSTQPQTGL